MSKKDRLLPERRLVIQLEIRMETVQRRKREEAGRRQEKEKWEKIGNRKERQKKEEQQNK